MGVSGLGFRGPSRGGDAEPPQIPHRSTSLQLKALDVPQLEALNLIRAVSRGLGEVAGFLKPRAPVFFGFGFRNLAFWEFRFCVSRIFF